jgi:hypothetical protein
MDCVTGLIFLIISIFIVIAMGNSVKNSNNPEDNNIRKSSNNSGINLGWMPHRERRRIKRFFKR